MEGLLLVLVDGLRASSIEPKAMPFLSRLAHTGIRPGAGFSINIHREILRGESPDDAGFLNYWGPRGAGVARRVAKVEALARSTLDRAVPRGQAGRALRAGLERTIKSSPLANVPFSMLPYLKVWGHDVYEGESIFSKPGWASVIGKYVQGNKHLGERDAAAVTQTLHLLRSSEAMDRVNNVYVLLADTDAITHRNGYGAVLETHLGKVDAWCESMAEAFLRRVPHGEVVVISDHGLAHVRQDACVDMRLEPVFGPVRHDTYLYMLDSVMLRVWSGQAKFIDRITDYLSGLEIGRLLTPVEREDLGVHSQSLGNILFVLHEGSVFAPNFLSGRVPKAAHGYWPWSDSQQAAFVSTAADIEPPATTIGAFDYLCELIRE